MRFKIGDRVKSVAVGSRSSFEGRVVEDFDSYYHVRDDDGQEWHRRQSELKRVQSRAKAA